MAHSRGFFRKECKGNYRKRGRPTRSGKQQWWCPRCGDVEIKNVKRCWRHQWKLDRRTKPRKYKCKKCPATRLVR